jgi:inner membrane protein
VAAVVSHALAGTAIAALLRPEKRPPVRYWISAAVIATIPDADILLVWSGAAYRGMWGHRGITHSLTFSLAAAAVVVFLLFRSSPHRGRLWAVFFLAGASHGFLDAAMASGAGVAVFAPFSRARFHFPWRPIRVSPPTENPLLNFGGLRFTASEVWWIWVPSVLAMLAASGMHRRPRERTPL